MTWITRHERAELFRAFALLKEQARGWLAKQPKFIQAMTPGELRLMADMFDDKPGAADAFGLIDLEIQKQFTPGRLKRKSRS